MVKIYGIAERLNPIKGKMSDVINQCLVDALEFPSNKRAQRFFPMAREDYYYPEGRTDAYTVIEFMLLSGRSDAARKRLSHLLFAQFEAQLGIAPVDLEIMIVEVPPSNYAFRGMTGDEAKLSYRVNV